MGTDTLAAWRPGPGEWNLAAASHLLERAGFGPAPGQAAELVEAGLEAALDSLFEPQGHEPAFMRAAELLVSAGQTEELAAWWIELMRRGGDPLGERLTLMWHDHFATSDAKVKDTRLMYGQNQLMRELGRGDFRTLLFALAKDPCMLKWLDGDMNRAGHPNENFGREVMELFVLGIGNYAEADIQELARALTGWGTKGRSFRYREKHHDAGPKELFGQRGAFSPEEGLELVLAQEAAPRHIARRILVEFVGPGVGEALVAAAATRLVQLDWHVGSFVRELLGSRAFFEAGARRSRIAAPVELAVRAARRLASSVPAKAIAEAAGDMGQRLFFPPSVKGWDGGAVWINAGSWTARHNALVRLVAEAEPLTGALGRPSSARHAVQLALEGLLPGFDDAPFRAALEAETQGTGSPVEALHLATALVLISPEYHQI